MPRTLAASVLVTGFAIAVAAQDHASCPMAASHPRRDQVEHRHDQATGVAHEKAVHHFLLAKDGGSIRLEAIDTADVATRDRIREHLQVVARSFAAGDFSLPMTIHDQVPARRRGDEEAEERDPLFLRAQREGRRGAISTRDARRSRPSTSSCASRSGTMGRTIRPSKMGAVPNAPAGPLRSAQLARLAGVSTDTLRLYEIRAVAPAGRSANGYREYPPEACTRVRLVRRALALGFTLDELASIVKVRDRGGAPCRRFAPWRPRSSPFSRNVSRRCRRPASDCAASSPNGTPCSPRRRAGGRAALLDALEGLVEPERPRRWCPTRCAGSGKR